MSKINKICKLWGQSVLGLLLLPSVAFAVGFGNLTVNSKLGESLDIEVELVSVTPVELGTLNVGLASRSDFNRAGIAYPETSAQLMEFNVVESSQGNYIVSITSQNPINETFLHFLLSANWSGGKVVREYTALLDPPLYTGNSGAVVEVPAVTSSTETSTADTSSSTFDSSSFDASSDAITVQRGDTLSGIVSRLGLPDSVSLYQGLAALLDANPDAFIDGNMNRLVAGAVLNIPRFNSISEISKQVALNRFQQQAAEYDQYLTDIGYRSVSDSSEQSTASADQEEPQQPSEEETTFASEEEESQAGDESIDLSQIELNLDTEQQAIEEEPIEQEEEARLSIGQELSDQELADAIEGTQGDSAQVEALKTQLAQLDESLLASGVESDEVKQRLKDIQEQVDKVSRLIEIEDSNLAMSQDRAADDDQAEPESVEQEQVGEQQEEDQALAVIDEPDQPIIDEEDGIASLGTGDQDSGSVDNTATDSSAESDAGTNAGAETTEVAQVASSESPATDTTSGNTEAEQENTTQATDQDNQAENASDQQQQTPTEEAATLAATNTIEDASQNTQQEPARRVVQIGILDNVMGMFGSVSDYMLKIVAAIIALIAGIFFYRRRKSQREFEESMLDIESGQISATTNQDSYRQISAASGIDLASQDSGLELTIGGGMSYLSEEGVAGVAEEENEVVQAGAVDPLAEADVYLAYDRDEQAIQVLKEAYSVNPERSELAEKLLEIYHKQDDRPSFDNLASELRSRIGAKQNPIWTKIVAMGKEVSPSNKLYSESAEFVDAGLDSTLELESGITDSEATAPSGLDVSSLDDIEMMELDLGKVEDQV